MSDSFERGLSLYSKGKFEEAKAEFLKIEDTGRKKPLADYYLGLCYVQLRDSKTAIKYYKKVRSIDLEGLGLVDSESFVYNLFINMGSAFLSEKEYEDAARSFEEALRMRNWDSRVKMNLANAYLYLHEHRKARELFESLVSNDSEVPEIYYCLGVSYLHTSEFLKARKMFEIAVKKQHRARLVLLRLYETLIELKEDNEANKLKVELVQLYESEEKLNEILEKKKMERQN